MLKRIYSFFMLRKALVLFSKQEEASGYAMLSRIFSFAPEYHFAYFHMACKQADKQDFAQAMLYIKKALTYHPKHPVYHTYKGIFLYRQGSYQEAKESLKNSIKLDEQNHLPYNYLALCHLALQDIKSFQKAMQAKGIFESTEMQIRLITAMETYLRNRQNCSNNQSITDMG